VKSRQTNGNRYKKYIGEGGKREEKVKVRPQSGWVSSSVCEESRGNPGCIKGSEKAEHEMCRDKRRRKRKPSIYVMHGPVIIKKANKTEKQAEKAKFFSDPPILFVARPIINSKVKVKKSLFAETTDRSSLGSRTCPSSHKTL
jgi:hypothetical protein